MTISFIGLGAMGYPMAGHLADAHDRLVWNRTAEVAEKHSAEHGSRVAESLDRCAESEVILTILPTSDVVDTVVDQLIGKLKKGTLWIDATSGDPVSSRKTAGRLAEKDIRFIDAPVTGGVNGAIAGELTVMVGGSSEDFVRAGTILKAFGSRIVHVGSAGAGHAVKAANNAMLAANMWAASECLLALRKLGIDLKSALEVLNSGSGRSFASEALLPSRILEDEWPLTFRLSLHEKDIRIAEAMSRSERMSTPILAMTTQLYAAAAKNLGADADYVEIARYVARMNGEEW
ncbi:MAG: NAD(P)-dependent oxidoreductase [Thermoanaerobaculia bacterium]|nr:NAD(P)-dependent oxidoreductase [Thermoanaerobaculia bacterium]